MAAKTELIELVGMMVPGGHIDTAERSAGFLYARELVTLVEELDKENRMPRVVVSSDQLARIPFGKKGLSPSDAVPISSRMNDLEDTVKKLCESFDKWTHCRMVGPILEGLVPHLIDDGALFKVKSFYILKLPGSKNTF